jgi:hypothetical protein
LSRLLEKMMTRNQYLQSAAAFVTVLVYAISPSLAETAKPIPSVGAMVEESLSCMREFYVEPLGITAPRMSVAIHPYQAGDELLALSVNLTLANDELPSLEVSFHFINGHLVFIGADDNTITRLPASGGPSAGEREQRMVTRLANRLKCDRFAPAGSRQLPDGTEVRIYRVQGRPCAASGLDILANSGLLLSAGVP